MAFIFEKLAVDDTGHFVDGIREQKPAVEHGDLGIGFRQPFAIEINDTGQDNLLQYVGNLEDIAGGSLQFGDEPVQQA